jgi:hypothetical protein
VDILKGLLGLECATATCPHCDKVNTFPGFSDGQIGAHGESRFTIQCGAERGMWCTTETLP